MAELQIIYDGDCPFCQRYVMLQDLRAHNDVELINAREQHPLKSTLQDQGYDLDEGMVLVQDSNIYHGADALQMISLLSKTRSLSGRLMNWLFRNPRIARICYPLLRAGRNLTLKLLGKKPINP